MGEKVKTRSVKSLLYLFLILLSVLCFTPFWLMIVNATCSGNEIMTGFSLLPGGSLADNWKIVSENMDLGRGFLNSLFLALCNTALVSYFSALTAYGLAYYKFKGAKLIFTALLVFMMVPSQLSMLGFYDLVNQMGLIDTYWPLILPSIASPATVFFLRQYILSVMPRAILEAPRIDGASELAIFRKIVLPIMAPGIATMAIGAFIGSWNNYLIPMLIINTPAKHPLPVMVAELSAVRDISPDGSEAEILDALIAGNNLPDLVTLGWWESQLSTIIGRDMVYALNELADEYDSYFWTVADQERLSCGILRRTATSTATLTPPTPPGTMRGTRASAPTRPSWCAKTSTRPLAPRT